MAQGVVKMYLNILHIESLLPLNGEGSLKENHEKSYEGSPLRRTLRLSHLDRLQLLDHAPAGGRAQASCSLGHL
jgi:hypothetical protein